MSDLFTHAAASADSNLPPADSLFWQSPALKERSLLWPASFSEGVPMRIRILKTVRPGLAALLLPEEQRGGMVLRAGETYLAWTNSHGSVAGICPNGQKLGVMPAEFEVVEWYPITDTAAGPSAKSGDFL